MTRRWRRRGCRKVGNYGEYVSQDSAEEIERFTEQARWLITYHDNRSESLCNRAVALLGFVGVILALLLGSGLPSGVEENRGIQIFFVVTVSLLLITSGCCLATLKSRTLQSPGVDQVRDNWRSWVTKYRRGQAAKDIAETFILAKDLSKTSPLDWAVDTADARADWFGRAVFSMALSLGSLTVLLGIVGAQVYF